MNFYYDFQTHMALICCIGVGVGGGGACAAHVLVRNLAFLFVLSVIVATMESFLEQARRDVVKVSQKIVTLAVQVLSANVRGTVGLCSFFGVLCGQGAPGNFVLRLLVFIYINTLICTWLV